MNDVTLLADTLSKRSREPTANGGHRIPDAAYDALWIARVRKRVVVTETGCWLWQGFLTEWGYAQAGYRGRTRTVHRTLYMMLHNVKLTHEQYVCHTCDIRNCVNPDHLWLGTNSDNQKDAGRKGRHSESSKTHCPQNHEYTPENTLLVKSASGGQARHCKTCTRDRHRRRYAQNSEARS